MKLRKTLLLSLILLLILPTVNLELCAKEKYKMKHFACKMITLDGRVYQTLLLGTDWKEIAYMPQEQSFSSLLTKPYGNEIEISFQQNGEVIVLTVISAQSKMLEFKLFDTRGNIIDNWNIEVEQGRTQITRRKPNLASGIYFIGVSERNNYTQVLKVLF